MKRLFFSLSLSILAMFCSVAHAADSPVIKIVSSLPRTGSANAQAHHARQRYPHGHRRSRGQIGDFTIAYEDWDDASPERGQWDPAVEAANAQKAVQDPDIMAYIGTYNSGAAKIAMPILNKASLVMVSPANTYPGLTKPGTGEANEPQVYRPSGKINFFRVVPADDIQGEVAAEWAKELGVKKVFVLHDRELYGKGVADVFKRACAKLGIEVVGYEGIDPKAANYRSLVTKIKSTDADMVYFGGTTQTNAGQIAKDLVAGGAKVKLMVPDGCREQALIESAGKDNLDDRTYVTFGGVPPNSSRAAARSSTRTTRRSTTPSPKPTPSTVTKPPASSSKASSAPAKRTVPRSPTPSPTCAISTASSANGPSTKTATPPSKSWPSKKSKTANSPP
jgi:branched-chain amino acid transport system substrate-binding protein